MWIAVCALIVAAMAGGFGLLLLRSQRIYEGRPTVPGHVLSTEIVKRPVRSQTFGAGGRLYPTWLLEVRYGYEVAGRAYTAVGPSTRRMMSTAEGSGADAPPAWMEEKRALYPVGKPVTVHYRPADPADSVIDIDRSGARTFLMVAGAALVVALLLWAVSRSR